jgi:hypothetical protein
MYAAVQVPRGTLAVSYGNSSLAVTYGTSATAVSVAADRRVPDDGLDYGRQAPQTTPLLQAPVAEQQLAPVAEQQLAHPCPFTQFCQQRGVVWIVTALHVCELILLLDTVGQAVGMISQFKGGHNSTNYSDSSSSSSSYYYYSPYHSSYYSPYHSSYYSSYYYSRRHYDPDRQWIAYTMIGTAGAAAAGCLLVGLLDAFFGRRYNFKPRCCSGPCCGNSLLRGFVFCAILCATSMAAIGSLYADDDGEALCGSDRCASQTCCCTTVVGQTCLVPSSCSLVGVCTQLHSLVDELKASTLLASGAMGLFLLSWSLTSCQRVR